MISIAIATLWFLIGLIILCGVIYFAIYIIEWATNQAIPEKIKQGVWIIVLILAIIALLTIVAGGSLNTLRPPFLAK